ncbi:hypothetical protein CRE_14586 [Caenorhabditis remanei]|uniref:Uncharacterized protein n=1 Tax=Caenorhabditis remanei TaxID=31234 RepID=E3M9P2_CAERE|nr:hypothetical protein CRE_14586 [Caenorhabditis remanei]
MAGAYGGYMASKGKEQLGIWDGMSEANITSFIEDYKANRGNSHSLVEYACPYISEMQSYKDGKKGGSYKICCDTVDYCSFYAQSWFYYTCGGVALLIVIILIVVSCCCCCKRRGGGGKDAESIETSDATKNEDY